MSTYRYTHEDAQRAFERLCNTLGQKAVHDCPQVYANPYEPGREGAWFLDYNRIYGGLVIRAYTADDPPRAGERQGYTAETHPLGETRCGPREFCEKVNFATRVLEYEYEHEREA